MRRTFWDFVKDQWGHQEPVVKADLAGQTVMVVGANTGLGFEASKHFATMNPGRLILACRSESKGQAAVEKLQAATGYTKAEVWTIDLSDFESVKQFATRFEHDGGRLDILVANAAAAFLEYHPTKDGWETSLQVNCLATPLLALLLLPAMIKTGKNGNGLNTIPTIVVVSSIAHYTAEIEKHVAEDPAILKILGSEEYCTPKIMQWRYHLTKLLNVFFIRALNARLPSTTPLIVDAVCPGYCYSELRRNISGVIAVVEAIMTRLLALPTEVGSRQLVWAAVAQQDHPETLRGAFISRCRVLESSDFVISAEGGRVQDRIWDDMVDILGKVDPRVNEIIDEHLVNEVAC
ncbi:hypothetical protein C8R43DRAFT_991334 [Mycena crocata]|nr:hypothetical protein C8R43DRAFT_991334 [Mycena crocata]